MQYYLWCMFIQNWSGLPTKCIQTVKEVVRCRGQTKGLGSTGASEKTYQGFWEPLPLCEQSLTWNSCTQCSVQSRVAEVARMREGPSPKSVDSDENFKPTPTLFCRDIKICRHLLTLGNLWAKKVFFFKSKTMFLGQKVHYYLVHIAYHTERNLQVCNYT